MQQLENNLGEICNPNAQCWYLFVYFFFHLNYDRISPKKAFTKLNLVRSKFHLVDWIDVKWNTKLIARSPLSTDWHGKFASAQENKIEEGRSARGVSILSKYFSWNLVSAWEARSQRRAKPIYSAKWNAFVSFAAARKILSEPSPQLLKLKVCVQQKAFEVCFCDFSTESQKRSTAILSLCPKQLFQSVKIY